ncbi:WD40-repeat-containing domain protein [Mycena galopus ATCC 62051]|nr:WD40-repeat-containing domain protein [Mycena galopus ATCC 62051]
MDLDAQVPTKFLVYEASLLFLEGACHADRSLSDSEARITVDDCIASMTTDSVVGAVVESLECRKTVFELSNRLELANDLGLRTAMRADEERITTLLVSIFSSKAEEETVLRLEGDSAQHFLDVVQEMLDRGFLMQQEHTRMAFRIIRKLSELCDRLPSSLFIAGVNDRDEHACFAGGFGDIYRASYGDHRVALKRMRHFLRGSDLRRIHSKFCREALLWKDLHHPNILPFLGIDRDSFPSSLCMVSPWMEHGTVIEYLKTHGHANVDKLLYEIAQGLEYLHSHNIIHGDLRGANILIQEDWSACLADFGLSTFVDATATISTTRAGSLYWMAPELLVPERFGLKFARTPATDVYAFGCVCFELYTGRPPFSAWPEPVALMKVLNGERPERPPGPSVMSDMLWRHVTEFLAESPSTRPSTQHVVQNMAWPIPGSRSSVYSAPLLPTGNPPDSTPDPATDDSFSSTTARLTPTPRLPQLLQRPGPAAVNDFLADSQDPAAFLPQFKKEGRPDWFAIYNPTTPRTLEVNIVHTFMHDSVVCCVQFSADGKWLATGCNRKAQIFDVYTGITKCVLVDDSSGKTGDLYIRSVRFSPDGKFLATGAEDNRIRIWDIFKRAIVTVFDGHQQEIYSLDFSTDGRLIVSGSGDGTVRIWDMEGGEDSSMRIFAAPEDQAPSNSPADTDTGVLSVAISPDGVLVAAGCVDAVVRIWSVGTGALMEQLRGHQNSVHSVVFTRDGHGIVSGSLDNTLKYWDLRGGKPIQCTTNFLGRRNYVLSVAESHDSQWFVSGSKDRGIQFWDRSGVAHCRLEGHRSTVTSVNLGPTDMLASGSGDCLARIWCYTSAA